MTVLSRVLEVPAADRHTAHAYFQARLGFETDPSDVYWDLQHNVADFVLVDVRSPEAYKRSHAVGAINIPYRTMTEARLAEFPQHTVFVVYCTGPGCNGADKAAVRLSAMGRPVKVMIGGITAWEDTERLPVARE